MNAPTPTPVEELLGHCLASCDDCLSRQDYTAAWQALCQAVSLAPNRADILSHRGRLALFLKDTETAQRDFAAALMIDPRCSAALSGLARYHWLQGEVAEAEAAADRALSIDAAEEEAAQVKAEIKREASNKQSPASSSKKVLIKNDVGLSHARSNLTLALLFRIRDAYHIAIQQGQGAADSMWSAIADRKLAVHKALMEEDIEPLKSLLTDPSRCDLFYGFENHFAECIATQRSLSVEEREPSVACHLLWLTRLGETLGVRRLAYPEQPDAEFHPLKLNDVESLLRDIDDVCGARITFPNPFPDDFGILTARGICSYRAIHAIYQAWKIRELSRVYGGKILEIGAGLGRTAFYARAFGLNDYTIVDLPMTSVASGIFLGLVAGSGAVSLLGEHHKPGQIRIMSPEWLFRTDESFDLVLNVDSITEMDIRSATRYAELAGRRAKAVLAINHEVGVFKAGEVLRGPLQLVQRHPYWMREGYCEELFTSKSGDTACAERDTARAERDAARAERDAARAERDAARAERNAAHAERDALRQTICGPFSTEIANDTVHFDARLPLVADREGKPISHPPELLFPPCLFRPLNVRIDPSLSGHPRLNILLPSTSAAHNSGGPNTAYILAAELAQVGVPIRIVAVNLPADPDSSAIRAHIARISGASPEVINRIELADGHNRGTALALGENDVFFATAWWTAQMVKYLLPRFRSRRFIYLIQDYEPNLHTISTNSVLALETYALNYFPVVNSRLLFDHFVADRVGRFSDPAFAHDGCWFEPSVDRALYHPAQTSPPPGRKRRLLFYARPDAPRNLLELGVAALMRLIDEGTFKPKDWDFHATVTGIGGSCRPVQLATDGQATLIPLPLHGLSAWAAEMQRTDVLLSLIWSPHTSYPPLEGAASGALVVTNTCGVKTAARLREISANIIAGAPTIEGIAEALTTAATRSEDWAGRVAGAQMGLPTTWPQSFQRILARLTDFLQAEGISSTNHQ